MKEEFKKLKEEFKKISCMGWIKSDSKNTSSAGCKLEQLMNIKSGKFEIPDYNGIEIKTKKLFSKSYIKLFNATPDGKYLFETKRLRDKYGYPDSKLKDVKVFNGSVSAEKLSKIGSIYSYKLRVDRKDKKIYLTIYNKKGNIIDEDTYWTFNLLEEKLLRKLQLLAVIDVLYKKENVNDYYCYNDVTFYKLRGFETFIDLVEKGFIRVTFKISIFRSGNRYKEMHDHGTCFEIKEENLKRLYEIVKI
jgi:hypothetical protein